MRRPFIAGNWKMHTTESEAVALARAVAERAAVAAADVAVCVPFPHLAPVREALGGTRVRLGAQDVFWEPGAPTPAKSASRCSRTTASS
ncbi:triose-phosphate isomerase [Tepidiforma flava]|uniref:Triose-phosphate isomerase n=1 Tax=Tepidiforma flava TaxID=3004094 RepID=A0ABY7M6S7_9CHLR|nr:triose-phosphate isomerase [Tepidiforma flava]WBL36209.1 triose-phosphate isomerase [Tepidiforma flava]